jgi:hypothetical protein
VAEKKPVWSEPIFTENSNIGVDLTRGKPQPLNLALRRKQNFSPHWLNATLGAPGQCSVE